MKRKADKTTPKPILTGEDRRLWRRVAQTTQPLNRSRSPDLQQQMRELMGDTADTQSVGSKRHAQQSIGSPAPAAKPDLPPLVPKQSDHFLQHPIEERTLKRLARGRQTVDGRIDLHGMTQDRAQFALLDYLQMAQRADYRIVLVITGKGNYGQGVLRINVPKWLKQRQFAPYVNGVQQSHPSHGGDGALYVRIRKPLNWAARKPGL